MGQALMNLLWTFGFHKRKKVSDNWAIIIFSVTLMNLVMEMEYAYIWQRIATFLNFIFCYRSVINIASLSTLFQL
jgi:hypothetical protein